MYIVITLPYFFSDEADIITSMFQSGLQRLHLRKPESEIEQVRQLLYAIPTCFHKRIVIHEHFSLLTEFDLCGIHLNRRNPDSPEDWNGHISISCHSIEELKQKKEEGYKHSDGSVHQFDYLSLSPIFDSISKHGYNAAFTAKELYQAKESGIIDSRVIALGGICRDNIEQVLGLGFGGIMVLGDAWTKEELPIVLSIAGSDTSAGAGIQQDLKTITNCGGYGTTVITALTSQNTLGVQDIMPIPANVVESQLQSVFSDLKVKAVKIGMIPDLEIAKIIKKVLKREMGKCVFPIICDPIMISTSGTMLMPKDCTDFIAKELFPICTLITPNIPEYESLDDLHTKTENLPTSILIKGGHADGTEMVDNLLLKNENNEVTFTSQRIETNNLHGTGCTLSSAIATNMALGKSLVPSIKLSKEYMDKAIAGGKNLQIGHGNGPLWYKQSMK